MAPVPIPYHTRQMRERDFTYATAVFEYGNNVTSACLVGSPQVLDDDGYSRPSIDHLRRMSFFCTDESQSQTIS